MKVMSSYNEMQFEEVPIYDNIHGFVSITKAEKDILNSIHFQRLRDLKQLSLAYYVFPSAVHTRFSHSIGVLSIMHRILERLDQVNPENVTLKDIKILRMAALLHDVGHYPLSHTIEAAYKELHKEYISNFEADDEEGGVVPEYFENLNKKYTKLVKEATSVDGHHERLGAYIIRETGFDGGITNILKNNNFEEDEIKEISLVIQGKSSVSWYNQIIHSELDVDRLDYLLRDSVNTGVKYGNFDFEYLVNNCRLEKKGEVLTFCIKASATFTVEHFLMARYFWYAQIIFDRTIAIFDYMAKSIYKWLINNRQVYDYVELLNCVSDPQKFINFNDMYFWEKIRWIIESEEAKGINDYEFYSKLASMLIERRPLKRIPSNVKKQVAYKEDKCKGCGRCEECHNFCSSVGNMEADFKQFVNHIKTVYLENHIDIKWIIEIESKVTVSKLENERSSEEMERDPVQIFNKNNEITSMDKQENSIISDLSDSQLYIKRIYTLEEYEKYIV